MTGAAQERVTYRAVLANREFATILVSQTLSTAGDQLARIAVAVLVFNRTDSGLAASATYATSYLTYLALGPVLAALSDRYPRLAVMVACDLLRAPLVLLLCISDLPLVTVFALLVMLGLLAPAFDSARSATQPEILQGEAYITGNAIMNITMQLGQVGGFVMGGALVALVSIRGALALDAATFLISAGLLLAGVRGRRAAQAKDQRLGLLRDTWEGIRFVRGAPQLRRNLLFSVLGSAALITPEGLAVPVAHDLGGGSVAAGVLTATIPAGFVVSGLLVLRLQPSRRLELMPWFAALAIGPLVLSPVADDLVSLTALWTIAGLGACLNLIASAAYIQACPTEFRSRAYGVAATILFATQGAALLVSGAMADAIDARDAIALIAAAMLVTTFALPSLRTGKITAQGNSEIVRSNQG